MTYQGRYIAIRHDGKALILEGECGEVYQYAERDFRGLRPLLEENRYASPDEVMHTRYLLKTLHVQGYSGRFRMYVPDDWPDTQCEKFIKREAAIVRLGPALMDPHQTDRSRQIERLYYVGPISGDQG
jgi:hypothetical protein